MRCFIGLPLDEEYQEKLESIVKKSKIILSSKISWTKKGNWHLTLCFLGDLPNTKVDVLKNRLKDIKFPSFELKAGLGGFFPSLKRPKVMWVGLEKGTEESKELAQKISNILNKLNIEFDKKEFIPHLTIGRIKRGINDNWKEWLKFVNSIEWSTIKISSFVLWQSTLTPSGPIYHPIEKYQLY